MKHLFNKLSAVIVILMCVSAMVQAEIVHHEVCEPTLSSRGFTVECWENTETGKFYSNEARTQELKDMALAKAVVYTKLPASPISSMYEFTQSEHENDWSVDFNWAAVTTFQDAKTNTYTATRYAEFTPTEDNVSNARLVWMRSHGDVVNGKYSVKIYVNGVEKFCVDQNNNENVEGVFVQPLPELKKGDVVKFEVTPNAPATWYDDDPDPTFKVSLEYTGTFENQEGGVNYDGYLILATAEKHDALDYNHDTSLNTTFGISEILEFRTNMPVSLESYSMFCGNETTSTRSNRNPKDWKLYGRQEGSDEWVLLSDVTDGQIPTVHGVESQPFAVNDKIAKFSYFKLEVTATHSLDRYWYNLSLADINFNFNSLPANYGEMYVAGDNNVLNLFDGDVNTSIGVETHVTKQFYIFTKHTMKLSDLGGEFSKYLYVQSSVKTFLSNDWIEIGSIHKLCNRTLSIPINENYSKQNLSSFMFSIYSDSYDYQLYDLSLNGRSFTRKNPSADIVVYTASSNNNESNNLFDNDNATIVSGEVSGNNETNWSVEWEYATPQTVNAYTLSTGSNVDKVPLTWRVLGKENFTDEWKVLSAYTDTELSTDMTSALYYADNVAHKQMKFMRLEILSTKNSNVFELAEFRLVAPCEGVHTFDGTYTDRCTVCGYVNAHTHDDNDVCGQCGQPNADIITGYVGGDGNIKSIMWKLNKATNVLTFTGSGEMETFNSEHNRWKNDYKDVVKKVIIGEGITKISDSPRYAMAYFNGMSGLTEVSLPSTLKTIGSSAFYSCSSLNSITLPEGLLAINASAFDGSSLQSVILPSTLTFIGGYAFRYTNIREVSIPSGVTSIGQYTFSENRNLLTVIVNGNPTINKWAFDNCSALRNFYLMSSEQTPADNDAFYKVNTGNVILHVNNEQYEWAQNTAPWNRFGKIVPLNNIEYMDAEGVKHLESFDTEASDNTWTLTDGCRKLTIGEDIPMQTLTYTRNFSAAGTWQPLYVPFEMQYSNWADKFDVAAITNFHEYTDAEGKTTKVELEVRYVKSGTIHANIPYLVRAKVAGENSIIMNNVTLKQTEANSVGCSSTERKYTFTGTYDAIDGLQTKDYIFLSGGRLVKSNNDTDILKPMRWYLTIENYFNMTSDTSAAFSKPIEIVLVGDTSDDLTGMEEVTVTTTPPVESQATDIHNLNGFKLNKPQSGINIINGKAVYVK